MYVHMPIFVSRSFPVPPSYLFSLRPPPTSSPHLSSLVLSLDGEDALGSVTTQEPSLRRQRTVSSASSILPGTKVYKVYRYILLLCSIDIFFVV